MSLLMIGCGKMGGSLLTRWATSTKHTITIINLSLVKAPLGVIVTQDIKELSKKRFDIIDIAIKPQLIQTVLPDYLSHLADSGCIISIAEGYTFYSREKLIGEQAILQMLLNFSVQISKGVSAIYANSKYSPARLTGNN